MKDLLRWMDWGIGHLQVHLKALLKPIFSVILGISLGLVFCWIAGENPWNILVILVRSSFGSRYDLGMTLFYATPLIFTGLSVSFAFHAGLFNIGAEGQMALGALASAATGIYFPHLQAGIAPIFGALAAFAFGSIWGLIPGWLRAFRGSHEVINTIMLNFIAAGICSWATLYLLKDPESQSPQTQPVGSNYLIHHLQFFGEAPVNRAIFLALALAVIIWFLLQKTVLGYEIRAVGQNEEAARAVGIQASRIRMIAMSIAGGLAGLVGVNEVFGSAGRFKVDFSPGYGFTGIAVALLGRSHPFGVVVAALLFGALHKGATDLDLETENVTRDLSLVLQAFVILCVCAEGLWSSQFFKRLKAFKKEDRSSVSL